MPHGYEISSVRLSPTRRRRRRDHHLAVGLAAVLLLSLQLELDPCVQMLPERLGGRTQRLRLLGAAAGLLLLGQPAQQGWKELRLRNAHHSVIEREARLRLVTHDAVRWSPRERHRRAHPVEQLKVGISVELHAELDGVTHLRQSLGALHI